MTPSRQQQSKGPNTNFGFTLIELIITLGILTLIGFGITTLIKRQMEAAQYNTARDNAQSEIERVFTDISKSWTNRRQTTNSSGYIINPKDSTKNNSLLIVMAQQNAAETSPNAFSSWKTICRPIPAELNLSPPVINELATMATVTCGVTCPVGERPVIEFKRGTQGDFNGDGVVDNQDFNATTIPGRLLMIPADWKNGPSRESVLGLGACFATGSSIEITFQSAFISLKNELQVQTRRVELRLETSYGSGVEVLR